MQPIGSTVSLIILAASTSRRFEFQKRRQLFARTRNETLSVVAVRVCNPDRSSALGLATTISQRPTISHQRT
jgi:hypothetical protein